MVKLMSEKNLTRDKAFSKSNKQSNMIYSEKVKEAMSRVLDPNSNLGSTHVLFLDKNHPNSDGIEKAIKEIAIDEHYVNVKKLYMIPKMESQFTKNLPFSLQFLAQAFTWG